MLAVRQALRDLGRRRVRSALTTGGIAIGVAVEALVLNRHAPAPRVSSGRLVPAPASDEVVLGNQVARLYHVGPDEPITLRGQRFQVVGILEPTLTGPDSFVFMSFPTAERLLVDSEPLLRRLLLVPGTYLLPH